MLLYLILEQQRHVVGDIRDVVRFKSLFLDITRPFSHVFDIASIDKYVISPWPMWYELGRQIGP